MTITDSDNCDGCGQSLFNATGFQTCPGCGSRYCNECMKQMVEAKSPCKVCGQKPPPHFHG